MAAASKSKPSAKSATAKSKSAPSKSASKSKSKTATAKSADASKSKSAKSAPQVLAKMPSAAEKREMAKQNRRAVKIDFTDGHSIIRVRPIEPVAYGRGGSVAVDKYAKVADAASAMACVGSDGAPIGRARIGTVQIDRVAKAMSKSKTTAHSLVGAKSAKQSLAVLRQYASAKIGRAALPDGVGQNISALAKSIGDPRKHKMNGRALAAAVVALEAVKH